MMKNMPWMPTFTISIQYSTGSSNQCNRATKMNKNIHIRNKEGKLYLSQMI